MRFRLTYANVMTTIALVLLLAGGTAFAASKLGKNTVGTKQLKKDAVTAKKIKKNAVTAAKIRKGAVSGAKIADGAVTGAKIDTASTPYTRVVARLKSAPAPFVVGTPIPIGTYTQPAGEVDQFVAHADIAYAPGCSGSRTAQVLLMLDPASPPSEGDIVAFGQSLDPTGTVSTDRVELIGTEIRALGSPASPVATTHTLSAYPSSINCTGGGSAATLNELVVEVIGSR